ncbi:hypothetical protein ACWCQ1_47065 [Streptomyces sp. NPDC002144]
MLLKVLTSGGYGETFTEPLTVAEVPAMAPGLGDVTAKSGPALAAAAGGGLICAAVTGFDDATGMSRLLLATAAGPTGRALTWSNPMTVAASDEVVYLQPQVAVTGDHRIAISVYALSLATLRVDVLLHLSDRVRAASGGGAASRGCRSRGRPRRSHVPGRGSGGPRGRAEREGGCEAAEPVMRAWLPMRERDRDHRAVASLRPWMVDC